MQIQKAYWIYAQLLTCADVVTDGLYQLDVHQFIVKD